jgi:hypothetical protein
LANTAATGCGCYNLEQRYLWLGMTIQCGFFHWILVSILEFGFLQEMLYREAMISWLEFEFEKLDLLQI